MTFSQLCTAINKAHVSGDRDTLFGLLLDFSLTRANNARHDIQDMNGIKIREDLPADMAQDFVLHILECMHTFEPNAPFAHWLNKIATRENLSAIRQEATFYGRHTFTSDKARLNNDDELEEEWETLGRLAQERFKAGYDNPIADADTKAVAGAISADPFMLAVAVLRDTEEYTDAEIAEKLGVTLDVLKSRVKRFTAKWGERAGAEDRIRRRVRHDSDAQKNVA